MPRKTWKARRVLRRRGLGGALALSLALIVACGGTSRRSDSPRPGPQGAAPGCGMYLFEVPACEGALDQGCCAQQQNCAADPNCARIVQCWNACESRRAAEGCNCFNNCAPQGTATPGIQLFG
ncbi:MAG: hypothetical protein KC492_17720, partial [Myxococcales bacterium]|nr:hypothetical protein [Myxococcales bacterium]